MVRLDGRRGPSLLWPVFVEKAEGAIAAGAPIERLIVFDATDEATTAAGVPITPFKVRQPHIHVLSGRMLCRGAPCTVATPALGRVWHSLFLFPSFTSSFFLFFFFFFFPPSSASH